MFACRAALKTGAMAEEWVRATDGVRIFTRVLGRPDGPTVVLVHGYPDNSSVWDGVVAELIDKYRVVTYDVRGHGRSGKPTKRAAYRREQLASDLKAVIDAVRPEGQVHLLAHDWGSVQSWYAIAAPELDGRVASYSSISGSHLEYTDVWIHDQVVGRRYRDLFRQIKASWYVFVFKLPVLPELLWRTGLMTRAIRRIDPTVASPELPDALHGLNLYRANIPARHSVPPGKIAVPVQVIVPVDDAFVTAPMQVAVDQWVPDLRISRIAGTHWAPRESPKVIAGMAAEWIEHVEARNAPPLPRRISQRRWGTHRGW
ncbi:alpha/beta fold hydrolase [Amycolatopsis sp. cg5]|uniref:alpha/beta fold hydrolase n=1 Tax=Amycolatopsis sp. cg5 TaxID=3238802 RepID=UPI003525504D